MMIVSFEIDAECSIILLVHHIQASSLFLTIYLTKFLLKSWKVYLQIKYTIIYHGGKVVGLTIFTNNHT